MTERICITVPDDISKKLHEFMNTYPENTRKNVSAYISGLIDTYTPKILID